MWEMIASSSSFEAWVFRFQGSSKGASPRHSATSPVVLVLEQWPVQLPPRARDDFATLAPQLDEIHPRDGWLKQPDLVQG